MPSSSRNEIILIQYPFSNLNNVKVRPATIASAPHASHDLMIVPLTSRMTGLQKGEFVLQNWQQAGLNVPTAVKRGIYTIDESLVIKLIGQVVGADAQALDASLREWLGL